MLAEHDIQIVPSSYYAHRRRPVTDALRAEAVLVNVVIDLSSSYGGTRYVNQILATHRI